MPQLPKGETKRVYLPSTESLPEEQRIWLEYSTAPISIGKFMEAYDGNKSEIEVGITILLGAVTQWNVTDENEQPLPVTYQNLMAIPASDMDVLKRAANSLIDNSTKGVPTDEKKESSLPSHVPVTVES